MNSRRTRRNTALSILTAQLEKLPIKEDKIEEKNEEKNEENTKKSSLKSSIPTIRGRGRPIKKKEIELIDTTLLLTK